MITNLIKKFEFTEDDRDGIFLSDLTKIRVNTENKISQKLQLKITNKKYPLDDDIFAKTKITTPNAVKKWLAIEVVGELPTGTTRLFRLDNGVNEYYWDSAAWVVAGPTDWNTEEIINDNISSFLFVDNTKSIRIVIKLKTTDDRVTPYITAIKMLNETDIDFYYDLVFATVVRTLKFNLKFRTDLEFELKEDLLTIDLQNDYKIENESYNIVGVESVYDITVDPMKQNNLFDDYVLGDLNLDGSYEPGVINLLSEISSNNVVHIRLLVIPNIAVNTNQDYYELKRVPSIVFENIIITESLSDDVLPEQESVKDKVNGTAVILSPPSQDKFRFDYKVFALLQTDLQNILESIKSYFNNNMFFFSYGLDEKYPVRTIPNITQTQKPDLNDTNTGEGAFEVSNVLSYLRNPETVQLVQNVNLDIQLNEN